MQEILYLITEYIIWGIILFIILFTIIVFLLIREKTPSFLLGMLRIVASIFLSPFIYLKNILLNLANYGDQGEVKYSSTQQYLLNKLILIMQGLLIVVAIVIIETGIIGGWVTFLPPDYLTERVDLLEDRVAMSKDLIDEIEPQVEELNEDWEENKNNYIETEKSVYQAEINRVRAQNDSLYNLLINKPSTSEFFNAVNEYLKSNSDSDNKYSYESPLNYVKRQTNNTNLSESEKKSIKKFADNWYLKYTNMIDLENITPESVRKKVQPQYEELNYKLSSATRGLENQLQELKSARDQVEYDFGGLLISILFALLQAIVLIWIVGTILELLLLGVDMAGNINTIRRIKEKESN